MTKVKRFPNQMCNRDESSTTLMKQSVFFFQSQEVQLEIDILTIYLVILDYHAARETGSVSGPSLPF